jgi:hypothetical protein
VPLAWLSRHVLHVGLRLLWRIQVRRTLLCFYPPPSSFAPVLTFLVVRRVPCAVCLVMCSAYSDGYYAGERVLYDDGSYSSSYYSGSSPYFGNAETSGGSGGYTPDSGGYEYANSQGDVYSGGSSGAGSGGSSGASSGGYSGGSGGFSGTDHGMRATPSSATLFAETDVC